MDISDANLGLLISLAVMLIAVVSVWRDVYDNSRPKAFFKRFTRVGKVLLITSFVFIAVNYFKDTHTEQKVLLVDIAKNKSDSASQALGKKLTASQEELKAFQNALYQLQISVRETVLKRVDSSYNRSIKASNEALAKYHIKIIDSLHTVVGTLKLNANNPQLALAPVTQGRQPIFLEKDGSDTLKIQFISANNTAYHIRLTAYFFLQIGENSQLLEKEAYGDGQSFINTGLTRTLTSTIQRDLLLYPQIKIVLYGSFSKDPYEKEIIPYLEVIDFNFRDNKFLGKSEIDVKKFKTWLSIQ
jgi:hypothetical protein